MAKRARRWWLMKTEPETFSWDDLERCPRQTSMWEGVRNYQARNLLRDQIKPGDGVLFYHSSTNPTAIVGLAEVVRGGYPDPTQFDARSKYYDEKSRPDDPRWFVVDVQARRRFEQPLTLAELRGMRGLQNMMLLRRGARLSVQPVTTAEARVILRAAGLEKALAG
jgi:predicted RNA-binding protein with PUA-like domain